MKAKRNLFLRAARHAFSGVVCAGAVLLFAASAQSQNLFVTDFWSGNVYEFTPGGVRTTFASGFTGPSGLAFNNAGNLFIGNEINGNLSGTNIIYGNSVTEITPDGTQSTFAFPVDEPRGLAFDSAGDLFVANAVPNSVYEIKPDGTQSTFASGGLSYPDALAFNSAGDLFVANFFGSTVYEYTPGGVQSTFASGLSLSLPGAFLPTGLAFDSAGNLFVADGSTGNIYEFTPAGTESIFASGFDSPSGLVFDSAGDLFVAEYGNGNIYKIAPGGVRSIFASGLDGPMALAFQPVPELVAAVTNGAIQVAVTMPSPYYSTIVQVSTDVVNWTSVYTNTPPFTFTDSMGTTLPCRFYRAMLAP